MAAQPQIPDLKNWVTDLTSTLSPGELSQLNGRLKTYEDTTSNQLITLMIPALEDYPIEYFTIETAEKNKIGTKENDNGLLFLIVKNERKMRIEVGYGLEGAIPDALASSIIRNVVAPHFKKEQYFAGIEAGINAIIDAIAGEYKSDGKEDDSDEKGFSGLFFLIMIAFFIFNFFIRGGKRRGSGFIFLGGLGGSSRGGGFGGGGGGFGGFSGGGGSFGGGGASGGW